MESGADDYVSKPFEEQELKVRLAPGSGSWSCTRRCGSRPRATP